MKSRYLLKLVSVFLFAVFAAGVLTSACRADSYTSVEPGHLVSQEDYDRNLSRSGEVFCDLYRNAWYRNDLSQALRSAVKSALHQHPERPNISFWHAMPEDRKEMRPYINYMVDLFMNAYDPFIVSIEDEFDEFFMNMTLVFFDLAFHSAENEIKVKERGREALANIRRASRQRLKDYGGEISQEVLDSQDARIYVNSIIGKALKGGGAVAGVAAAGAVAVKLGVLVAAAGPPGWLVGGAAAVAGSAIASASSILARARAPEEYEVALFEASEISYRDDYPVQIWDTVIKIVAQGVLKEIERDVISMRDESLKLAEDEWEDEEDDPDILRALEKAHERDNQIMSKDSQGGY